MRGSFLKFKYRLNQIKTNYEIALAYGIRLLSLQEVENSAFMDLVISFCAFISFL